MERIHEVWRPILETPCICAKLFVLRIFNELKYLHFMQSPVVQTTFIKKSFERKYDP